MKRFLKPMMLALALIHNSDLCTDTTPGISAATV